MLLSVMPSILIVISIVILSIVVRSIVVVSVFILGRPLQTNITLAGKVPGLTHKHCTRQKRKGQSVTNTPAYFDVEKGFIRKAQGTCTIKLLL